MSSTILFVFEGKKTEPSITESLSKFYINEHTRIQVAFCGDVYQLYNSLYKDDDLDTFSVLKARDNNSTILAPFKRTDFAEIYLFFDYDGHASAADDDVIEDLLIFFSEETEYGKLLISYPMVESLKHVSLTQDFKDLKVPAKSNIQYKTIVHNECPPSLRDVSSYTKKNWLYIIKMHLMKVNYLINDKLELPRDQISQSEIFLKQMQKYISIDSTVAVLSSFPMLLLEYYGATFMRNEIESSS